LGAANAEAEDTAKPRAGFFNPLLYALRAGAAACHDLVPGNNDIEALGKYPAGPGGDTCRGLGSPVGGALIGALAACSLTSPCPGP
jgi:hypothetical protein